MPSQTFHLAAEHRGLTLAAALRRVLPDHSWSQVRKLISGRRVQVNGNLCLDEERKVSAGDVVKTLEHALAPPATVADVRLVHVDEHLVVVQKPAGVTTLRHREESDLPARRKQLQPTFDELVQKQLSIHLGIALPADRANPSHQRGNAGPHRRVRKPVMDRRLRLRPVHRLDRDTSGLMVFARSPEAEQKLIQMFARHDVQRAYVAAVYGEVHEQTIDTQFVRDRGDGLRGSMHSPTTTDSGNDDTSPRRAVTHVRPLDQLAGYTVVECRLQTGRTHQIRIHLSELGHRVCGEKMYTHALGQPPLAEVSGAPRQALHAASLAFVHPITNRPLRFQMPLPPDLKAWLLKLRR